MIIRKAKLKDLKFINQLDKESVAYHKRLNKKFYTLSKTDWNIKIKSQKRATSNPNHIILVVEKNKKIIGYVWIAKGIKKCIIQELVISKDFRIKGIGKKLIKKGLNLLKRRGYKIFEVKVLTKNKEAIKFYKKIGFKYKNKSKIFSTFIF